MAKRDRKGRLVKTVDGPENQRALWMHPNYPGPCADAGSGCSGYVGTDDVACVVLTTDPVNGGGRRWILYHACCAPTWTTEGV